jgi:hypothetical protein
LIASYMTLPSSKSFQANPIFHSFSIVYDKFVTAGVVTNLVVEIFVLRNLHFVERKSTFCFFPKKYFFVI